MYDSREIEKIVKQKRKMLITEFAIIITLMIVALVLLIVNINSTVTFICIIAELALLFAIYKIFDVQSPSIWFFKEIRGVNIKEDEYVSRKTPGPGLSWRQVGGPASPQPFAPNTGANRRRTPPNIRSRVYLQLEDENIVTISTLYKSHTELFVEGDTLLKYAGTHFPIVISREMQKQPCPICGEVNDMSDDACNNCGLSIIKTNKGEQL
ncbi:MAG: hypothetical protein E7617_03835 [Ruminococcaceae bacterium]|nr:hypothetical protein [Oscillospiraceae bacterium]